MFLTDLRMALQSISRARWHSLMTMLGVIIGVMSVVTILSIGEGVKREITGQINQLGADLITVRPGRAIVRSDNGDVQRVNLVQAFTSSASLAEADIQVAKDTSGVGLVTPLSILSVTPSVDSKSVEDVTVIGATDNLPQALHQKVQYGGFFEQSDANTNSAVIGSDVAHRIFKEIAPIGRSINIGDESFVVRGVFQPFPNSPLALNTDYNTAVFIPYEAAKRLNNNQPTIQQLLVRPTNPGMTDKVTAELQARLIQSHNEQKNVTVLGQQDNLAIANYVVNLLSGMISAVAAISLIVGGVGIMNIMLVSVSERTGEIGIRKAVGATNRQILAQFLIEASVISLIGGVVGIMGSLLANYFIRIFSDLKPVVTWQVSIIALAVALIVGMFFGVTPAIKAARKDPIEALRSMH